MITIPNWMFLASFYQLRIFLLIKPVLNYYKLNVHRACRKTPLQGRGGPEASLRPLYEGAGFCSSSLPDPLLLHLSAWPRSRMNLFKL